MMIKCKKPRFVKDGEYKGIPHYEAEYRQLESRKRKGAEMSKTEAINLLMEIKEDIIESDDVSLDKIKALNYAIVCITNSRERSKDEY